MPDRILKYPLPFTEEFSLRMPVDAEIIRVDAVVGHPCIWVKGDDTGRHVLRYFYAYKTGEVMSPIKHTYIGHVPIKVQQELTVYIFEVPKPVSDAPQTRTGANVMEQNKTALKIIKLLKESEYITNVYSDGLIQIKLKTPRGGYAHLRPPIYEHFLANHSECVKMFSPKATRKNFVDAYAYRLIGLIPNKRMRSARFNMIYDLIGGIK